MNQRMRLILTSVACLLIATAGPARAEAPVDFTRDVRPLLARYCFKCHGPDPKARKAELRLDDKEDALRDRGGYAAIVPGDVDASELIARIDEEDDASRMPPPEMKVNLTRAEKDVLRRGDRRGGGIPAALGLRPAPEPPGSGRPAHAMGGGSYRSLRPGTARVRRPESVAAGRPVHAHPPGFARPGRPPPDARGGRRLRRRSL